eukprot:CAMPEP_0181238186 /NCGR_PEP_ID=MMETSP1096-20121128/39201_1 /TAXON_ID=156174 ORGANISM="Chrysochromulina ericina, Strain CCMP281" /NCGR_SAMPLE_ID=MMETSP1096 /ASSEMBLY_ACC=CAM_ASM_000453 /LENGTH=126 /DNA_ID=CAMNT_0023333669 /DNA_START=134 /DNA_END=511 /DNA_ORIENTATION=+
MAPPKPNLKKLGYTKSVGADDDNVLTPRTRSRCQLFVTIVLVLACIWVLLPLALMPEEPQASSWEQPYDGEVLNDGETSAQKDYQDFEVFSYSDVEVSKPKHHHSHHHTAPLALSPTPPANMALPS